MHAYLRLQRHSIIFADRASRQHADADNRFGDERSDGSWSAALRLPRPATPSRPKYLDAQHKRGIEMSAQDNKDVVEKGYAAFSAGDLETVMSLFDDNIEWVQPGETAVSGTFHGKAELMEHIGRLAEKSLMVKLDRLIADGDTVVGLTEVTAGGETSRDADVFTLRDGKVVHVRVFGDTSMMERVYGKKQLAAG
jgi:ketosteroid isomerase-like protein